MSPEQAEGKEADERSDIFSFGTVLYEMITGPAPFAGDTKTAMLAAILRISRLRSQHQPMVPRAFDRVVRKCLEKKPADRWQSAHDLKPTLELIDLACAARQHREPQCTDSSSGSGLGSVIEAWVRDRAVARCCCRTPARAYGLRLGVVAESAPASSGSHALRDPAGGQQRLAQHLPRRPHVGLRRHPPRRSHHVVGPESRDAGVAPARRHRERHRHIVLVARQPHARVLPRRASSGRWTRPAVPARCCATRRPSCAAVSGRPTIASCSATPRRI